MVLDIETSNIVMNRLGEVRLVMVGLLPIGGEPESYVIDHRDCVNYGQLDKLRERLNAYRGLLIGHNLLFEYGVLQHHGITFPNASPFDTMLALKCYNENETRLDLKTWATYLGYPPYWLKFKEALENGGAENMNLKDLEEYNLYDLWVTESLYQWVKPRMEARQPIPFQLEMDVLPLVARMQNHGLGTEESKFAYHAERLAGEQARLEQEFYETYGQINLASYPQVASLLFDKLGLKQIEGRSTAEKVLMKLDHPAAKHLLAIREPSKQMSTYIDPLWDARDAKGIVRGDTGIHRAETGRFSIRKPPLQTLPEKLRDIFSPQFGKFLWPDLSQVEYRIAADVSGEAGLVQEIINGLDVHAATAQLIFGDASKEYRSIAKTVNFGKLYGAGLKKIAESAKCSMDKAKEIEARYNQSLPNIISWIARIHKDVEADKEIETPFGRKRKYEITPRSWGQAQGIKREAVNFIPQSMGHDSLLTFWIELDKRLAGFKGRFEYANEVHDEVVIDVSPEIEKEVTEACKETLADLNGLIEKRFGYRFKLPITGSVSSGAKWS